MYILKQIVRLSLIVFILIYGIPAYAADTAPNTKIYLVWDWTAPGETASNTAAKKIDGITVISPKWFALKDKNGRIVVKDADKHYIESAHENGYKVWPLISNSFDPKLTSSFLDNKKEQKRTINNKIKMKKKYGFDGYNIDFENVNEADRDKLTSFIKDIKSKITGTISIDVTIPSNSSNWSRCYDRKALADTVDYVMVMAYDEHGRLSPVSGSVASLPWVENGIKKSLEYIPHDKLVLGMPLYMRLWTETTDGTVSAKTLSMQESEKLAALSPGGRIWNPDLGQYYYDYIKDGKMYRVWEEDARSLALKASLISRYDLAGGAFWRKGLEDESVWPVIAAEISNAER